MEVTAGLGIRDPPSCPAADEIHIAGNRLALGFTESTTNSAKDERPKKKEGVAGISWSPSIMRLTHNDT